MGAPESDEACSEDQELLTANKLEQVLHSSRQAAGSRPRLLLPTLARSKCSGEIIQALVKKTCRHPAARGHHSDRFAYIFDRIQRVVIRLSNHTHLVFEQSTILASGLLACSTVNGEDLHMGSTHPRLCLIFHQRPQSV